MAERDAAALWRAGADFDVSENRLAFGGRVIDLRVPGATYRDVHVPLHGRHQGANAAVALAAVTAFLGQSPSAQVVESGLGRVAVPGRLEVLGHRPLCVVDGAHNPAGAAALAQSLEEGFDVTGPMVLVLGMLQGRDPRQLLEPLIAVGLDQVLCVEPETPRALPAADIAKVAADLGARAEAVGEIDAAVDAALELAGEDGLVLASGSLYVVGPARRRLLERIVSTAAERSAGELG